MTEPIISGTYSHDLLVHDSDEELVEGIRPFVEQGLESGGHVIVHSSQERVDLLQKALGSRPRLEYGLDEDLYLTPTSTLFAYQRRLAEANDPVELWATGTVPLGPDTREHASWCRYESLVNEVLGAYAFHGLCTYDTRSLPETTIAAARAAHPYLSTGTGRTASPEYLPPADFLADSLAAVPGPPADRPAATMTLHGLQHLGPARGLLRQAASATTVTQTKVDGFVAAVHEVLVNGLAHGRAPVRLSFWVEPERLSCLVVDEGAGVGDPLVGYRYPGPAGPRGLWAARQLCEDIFVRDDPGVGCSVLLITT